MGQLSNDPRSLKDRYGVVVIGSGYGGSIAAARLAEQGHSVCLLERGKEWIPGRFPDHFAEVVAEMRSPLNPLGLFDYQIGDDLDVLAGNGLGGTSLINANVIIKAEDAVFQHARWPAAIREAAAQGRFEPYQQKAKYMLQTTAAGPPGGWPAKVDAMKRSSAKVEGKFFELDVAVNLREYDNKPNHVGVVQRLCTLCGDCVTGCNVGAKNTLYVNYLPLAKTHGAKIFTGMEVDYLVPAPAGGYFVCVRRHDGVVPPVEMIHANAVLLGAGALGTTGILLRSRERGLALSRRLGHHFSSNADQLGIGYNTDRRTDVLGFGDHNDTRARIDVGPTILSRIDFRDRPALDGRFIIEEGAIPRALVDAIRSLAPKLSLLEGRDTDAAMLDEAQELARIVRDQVRYDPDGAANHSMLYLGMGHDGADGRIVLDHEGRPKVLWGAVPDRPVFSEIHQQMFKIVAALGGTYIKNPRWSELFGRNAITVHPLGGCPMGEDSDSGVVNHFGQAFDPNGQSGNALHAGLFVMDGSILPTSLGVNPMLTISVLAERIADHINEQAPGPITPATDSLTPPVVAPPPVGLEFTEEMKGFFTTSIHNAKTATEYEAAAAEGRKEQGVLDFKLTIIIDDLQRFIESKEHGARTEGYVDSVALGRKRRVEEGLFNLFIQDEQKQTKRMLYRLKFFGPDDEKYLLDGFKEVRNDPGVDVWHDNTTLYTTVRKGWSTDDPVLGQGIVHVKVADFLEQLTTFRVRNSPGAGAGVRWMNRFGQFFFGELWETYVRPLVPGAGNE